VKSLPATKARSRKLFDTKPILQHEKAYAVPADIVIGLSQSAINKFLSKHFDNNPQFYDRSRTSGAPPLYSLDVVVNVSGQPVHQTIKFYAKVAKPSGGDAVSIDLMQTSGDQQRFLAWWRLEHGQGSVTPGTQLPPNVKITVPAVTLQVDVPRLDGTTGQYDQIDFPFSIVASVFVRLGTSGPDQVLSFVDWDIEVTAVSDPILPDDPRWGQTPPACDLELKRLRQFIANAFKLGANVALTQLSKTLVKTIPLPPINIVNKLSITPRELYVEGSSIVVTATMSNQAVAVEASRLYQQRIAEFERKTSHLNLTQIFSEAPRDAAKREKYLRANIPAYADLTDEFQKLTRRKTRTNKSLRPLSAVPSNDLFVMVSGGVFQKLAHELLSVNAGDCTDWWKPIDILVGYARGRACYWFRCLNGHGDLNGTDVSMGCDIDAGGKLDLQACVRIPCAPDQCTTWSPGFGLKGPLQVVAHLRSTGWDSNQAVQLNIEIGSFPGFEVYGLPPVVGDVADAILNWVSGVALTVFFNSIISSFNFYLISIQENIPGANVKVDVHQLGVVNDSGYLVVTGTTTFQ
jgi:hypothetical protein